MPKLRVHSIGVSLDGYAAGPNQGLENPLGEGAERLHDWAVATRAWRGEHGMEGGEDGIESELIEQSVDGIGATVMGRNMFGPVRGPWGDEDWRGWWGEEPPYHHDVFVLTHHPRPPLPMAGGTTFHFVEDGIESALAKAFDAAGGRDVRLGGGASTIQQYLRARLIDELHIAVVPIFLGGGERLFDDLDGGPVGYEVTDVLVAPSSVVHVQLAKV